MEGETVIKIIEISLDLIELLLSSLPECLFNDIQKVIICFLTQLSNRREMIAEKANDLINLARETLGADFLLPHLVSILNDLADDPQQIKTKISALEVLNVLIKESESLGTNEDNYHQYSAIIKSLGGVIRHHSSQRSIINPVIGAILSLRDKNIEVTFKAFQEELPSSQNQLMRHLINQHERTLARQLSEFINLQNQQKEKIQNS